MDATIASTEMTQLTDTQKKYIDFDVHYYDTGEEIKRCDELKVNEKRPIIITVKLKEGLREDEYPSTDTTLNLFYKINYVQSFECPTTPSEKHILKIRPNGGVYKKRTTETRIYLNEGDSYDIANPTRKLYNFDGWEIISPTEDGTYSLTDNHFVMGKENVVIQVKWLEGNYVARIMDTYYEIVQDAFNAVGSKNCEDNTVWLLKDVTESPVNNTDATNGTLVLGIVDDSGTDSADVSYTNPHISGMGSEIGIGVRIGDGSLEFYDGYIVGSTSPRGDNTQTAKTNKNYQVVFLHDDETGYDYSILEYMK